MGNAKLTVGDVVTINVNTEMYDVAANTVVTGVVKAIKGENYVLETVDGTEFYFLTEHVKTESKSTSPSSSGVSIMRDPVSVEFIISVGGFQVNSLVKVRLHPAWHNVEEVTITEAIVVEVRWTTPGGRGRCTTLEYVVITDDHKVYVVGEGVIWNR